MEPKMVRQLWHLIEPVHALVYYAPELSEEGAALGLPTDERWPGYFALRSAPLGPVGPELITATYYSFSRRCWPPTGHRQRRAALAARPAPGSLAGRHDAAGAPR